MQTCWLSDANLSLGDTRLDVVRWLWSLGCGYHTVSSFCQAFISLLPSTGPALKTSTELDGCRNGQSYVTPVAQHHLRFESPWACSTVALCTLGPNQLLSGPAERHKKFFFFNIKNSKAEAGLTQPWDCAQYHGLPLGHSRGLVPTDPALGTPEELTRCLRQGAAQPPLTPPQPPAPAPWHGVGFLPPQTTFHEWPPLPPRSASFSSPHWLQPAPVLPPAAPLLALRPADRRRSPPPGHLHGWRPRRASGSPADGHRSCQSQGSSADSTVTFLSH